jgi:hypothetical protein
VPYGRSHMPHGVYMPSVPAVDTHTAEVLGVASAMPGVCLLPSMEGAVRIVSHAIGSESRPCVPAEQASRIGCVDLCHLELRRPG